MRHPISHRLCRPVALWLLSEWVMRAQPCLTLCDSMDCSLPGSSVHGISQARIQEYVAISFSKGSDFLKPGIESTSPALTGIFFTAESSWKSKHHATRTDIITNLITEIAWLKGGLHWTNWCVMFLAEISRKVHDSVTLHKKVCNF